MPDIKHAQEWLAYAQRDYDFAVDVESHFWPKHIEKICYNCQQAAEKALKAILAYHDVEIPRTHNIKELVDKCKEHSGSIELENRVARQMTRYATISRYPDSVTEWDDTDGKVALKYAKEILDMVRQYIDAAESKDT